MDQALIDRTGDRRHVAAKLADRICGFDRARISAGMTARAAAHIADTLAVTLAGAGADAPRLVGATLGATASGAALIFGTKQRASLLDAALVNATAAHAGA